MQDRLHIRHHHWIRCRCGTQRKLSVGFDLHCSLPCVPDDRRCWLRPHLVHPSCWCGTCLRVTDIRHDSPFRHHHGQAVDIPWPEGRTQRVLQAVQRLEDAQSSALFLLYRSLYVTIELHSSLPVFAYFGVLNTTQFNGRTRALNGFLAGAGPIFAALLLGVVHDRLPCSRQKRAFCGLALVATFVMVTWGGGLAYQLGFTRQTPVVPMDWEDPRAAGPITLLMSCE